MNKYIIIILAALCLFACDAHEDIDGSCMTVMNIENNSIHNITIKADSKYVSYWETTIPKGSCYSAQEITPYTPVSPQSFVGTRCIVTFDNDIEIVHSSKILMEHSLCDQNSYTVKVSGKHKTETTYTYTFTDEDYDRAVAASKEGEA